MSENVIKSILEQVQETQVHIGSHVRGHFISEAQVTAISDALATLAEGSAGKLDAILREITILKETFVQAADALPSFD